jgi:hypothetical protein
MATPIPAHAPCDNAPVVLSGGVLDGGGGGDKVDTGGEVDTDGEISTDVEVDTNVEVKIDAEVDTGDEIDDVVCEDASSETVVLEVGGMAAVKASSAVLLQYGVPPKPRLLAWARKCVQLKSEFQGSIRILLCTIFRLGNMLDPPELPLY